MVLSGLGGELGVGQVVATGGRRSSMRAGSAGKTRQGTDGVGGQAWRGADAWARGAGGGRRHGWRQWRAARVREVREREVKGP